VETSRRTQVRRRLKSAPHLLICLFLLLPLCHAAKDEVVAAGQIERIMDRSITIRRADGVLVEARLLHTGKLRADVLVTKFHFGDNVEMACKAIPPVWDDDARLYRVLELERIDLLKKPSANEYYIAASSRAWREPGNMLKLLHPEFVPKMEAGERAVDGPPEARQTFEQARQVNLKYVAAIPTYMADETATRATADSVPPRWRPIDVILADVTFHGDMETRDQVFSNNRLIPGGMKDVNAFSVYSFEAGDDIIQTVPAKQGKPTEYALLHKIAEGTFLVIAIDEDDIGLLAFLDRPALGVVLHDASRSDGRDLEQAGAEIPAWT